MNKNLEKIKLYIEEEMGEEVYQRLLEILKILGVESPKECRYVIKYKYDVPRTVNSVDYDGYVLKPSTRTIYETKEYILPEDRELLDDCKIDVFTNSASEENCIAKINLFNGYLSVSNKKIGYEHKSNRYLKNVKKKDSIYLYDVHGAIKINANSDGRVSSIVKLYTDNGIIDTITSWIYYLQLSSTGKIFPIREYYKVLENVLRSNLDDNLTEKDIQVVLKLLEYPVKSILTSVNWKNRGNRRGNELELLLWRKEDGYISKDEYKNQVKEVKSGYSRRKSRKK